jgi:hypothetical protein
MLVAMVQSTESRKGANLASSSRAQRLAISPACLSQDPDTSDLRGSTGCTQSSAASDAARSERPHDPVSRVGSSLPSVQRFRSAKGYEMPFAPTSPTNDTTSLPNFASNKRNLCAGVYDHAFRILCMIHQIRALPLSSIDHSHRYQTPRSPSSPRR